ncbi:MAG: hypothetical protein Q4E69_06755 [Bacilli bacterium]|nr:hypothetical protein [Bacilli bacterium]
MKKAIKNLLLVVICAFIVTLIISVKANNEGIVVINNDDYTIRVENDRKTNTPFPAAIAVEKVKAGKRISDILYCEKSQDCTDDSNWQSLRTVGNNSQLFDTNNELSNFINSTGSDTMFFDIDVPHSNINVKATTTDLEPMGISYSLYETDNNNENEDDYFQRARDLNNYSNTYSPLATGYRGGDIVLPDTCTNNGCVLKFTVDATDYQNMINRLNYFNQEVNGDMNAKKLVDLQMMFNHTDHGETAIPIISDGDYFNTVNEQWTLRVDTEGTNKVFYIVVTKFINEHDAFNIQIAENKSRVLTRNYIGLHYKIDSKYFDEGGNFGFLYFNNTNNYSNSIEMFYGTPTIQLIVDELVPAVTTSSNMPTLLHTYNKIVSKDNTNYPISNSFVLTINSFYNPEYVIPIELKNGNTHVQDINLTLSRFAFGGNAGGLLVVDDQANNCMDSRVNQNCTADNLYVSTSYRGLFDTFYSDGTTTQLDNVFELRNVDNKMDSAENTNMIVYNRNLDFTPWAIAIFYSGDTVVGTKSFNLGELLKVEGITDEAIPANTINGHAYHGNELVTNYNPENYDGFFYGFGYEKSMNEVKYFDESTYNGRNISLPLVLASKEDIESNHVTRINLFLTNGELNKDENNFPELKYGVGEGKEYFVGDDLFDRVLGGNH